MMDFWSFLYGTSKAVAEDAETNIGTPTLPDEFTMAEHNAKFHPNGRHEGDSCKYDQMAAEEADAKGDDLEESDAGDDKPFNNGLVTPEEDAAYAKAVALGDNETAQKMLKSLAAKAIPDTKIKFPNGKPQWVYHGSAYDFNEFKPTGENGIAFGIGAYFSSEIGNCFHYGHKIKPLYVNITNPLVIHTIREFISLVVDAARESGYETPDSESLYWIEQYDYGQIISEIENQIDPHRYTGSYIGTSLYKVWKDFINNNGYDGVIYTPREEIFKPDYKTGIKLAYETYSDDGKLIPLSQRFNFSNPDIRY